MQLGEFEIHSVSGGRLRLDGGNMFGVVPKVMWEKALPADERNRVEMDTNCLLVRTPEHLALVDTGYGTKATDRERENFHLQEGQPLIENLAALGVAPQQVDLVILTHLHFDHAGGCTYRDAQGNLAATFPHARHVVQLREWEDAGADLPELKGSYFPADFSPLADAGLVDTVDGDAQIAPGILVRLTGGHSRGHQVVDIRSGDEQAVYLGDICPLTSHLKTFWTMAYDQFPLEVRRVKPKLLSEIADRGWLALFDHDPQVKAARLNHDEKGAVAIDRVLE